MVWMVTEQAGPANPWPNPRSSLGNNHDCSSSHFSQTMQTGRVFVTFFLFDGNGSLS